MKIEQDYFDFNVSPKSVKKFSRRRSFNFCILMLQSKSRLSYLNYDFVILLQDVLNGGHFPYVSGTLTVYQIPYPLSDIGIHEVILKIYIGTINYT